MLDTNAVSDLLKRRTDALRHLAAFPVGSLCISAITRAELLYGLAKRPEARRLHAAVRELFKRIDTLPWDVDVAERYANLRADLERRGRMLGGLDMQIAAHAITVDAILVTRDRAFSYVDGLDYEDWSAS